MTKNKQIFAVAIFFLAVFVVVPLLIAVTGRKDFYYTLTSVALLSIASAGVWLTFFIGRINIGQGAYALMGGYVSAVLVMTYGVSFWWTLPIAGIFCALASVLIGFPILRLRGVYFAMVTLVLTEVTRLLALALPITRASQVFRCPAHYPCLASQSSLISLQWKIRALHFTTSPPC
jgi:branched-chain amino acid transport system permease protein